MSLWNKIYWSPEGGGGGSDKPPEDDVKTIQMSVREIANQAEATRDLVAAQEGERDVQGELDVMRLDRVKVLKDEISLLERKIAFTTEINKKIDYQLEMDEKALQLEIESTLQSEEFLKLSEKLQEARKAELADKEERLVYQREGIEVGKELAETMFGLATASKQADFYARLHAGGIKGVATGFKGLITRNSALNSLSAKGAELALGFAGAVIKLAAAQDTARSQFMKSTGAGMEYGQTISTIQRATALYGVDSAEAGQAVTDLYTSFSQFSQLSETSQRDIGETVSLLAELGVSSSVSAKNLDIATRSLGLNATEAEELLLEIKATSDAIGLPASKLAEDFSASAPVLAKYGRDMMSVFEGLAKHSKQTGIEMGQLLNITGKFDTFEDSARAVGRLNAILGGPYLNSIDLLNATDEERISILQRLTNVAGLQFDELNRFERMAIADALGVSVDEANRIFGATTAQFEKQRLAQKKLADQAAEAQSVIDQLKAAFNAMLVDMQPLIEERILPMVRGFRSMVESSGQAAAEIYGLTKAIIYFSTYAGAAMIAGGVIGLIATKGAAAAWAVPMIVSGAKMFGVGIAGHMAMDEMEDAAAQGMAGVQRTQAAVGGPTSRQPLNIPRVSTVVPQSALQAAAQPPHSPVTSMGPGGVSQPAQMPTPGAPASQAGITGLPQKDWDLLTQSVAASNRVAAAVEKSSKQPATIVLGDRNFTAHVVKHGTNKLRHVTQGVG